MKEPTLMPLVVPPKVVGPHLTLTEHGQALAVLLAEEFGVPFTLYQAATGALILKSEDAGSSLPDWTPAEVARLVADGPVRVDPPVQGRYPVALLSYRAGKPVLVAVGAVPALARTTAEASQERTRLRKWIQSVCDRLRQADAVHGRHRGENGPDAPARVAWEALLKLDCLLRRVRIHKESFHSQQRILQAAFGMLGVQTLVWVPRQADAPVVLQGEPSLSSWDCRQLAILIAHHPELQQSGMLVCNLADQDSWAKRFPNIANLLAFAVTDQEVVGWVLALNKQDPEQPASGSKNGTARPAHSSLLSFRRSDAALLTPFVALLEFHVRSTYRYRALKELLVGLARSLTSAIDAKDSYTFGHSERVARIAVELGRDLGLPEDELSDIYLAGLLHDIGKIGVPDAILGKAGPLTPDEFEQIKQHVTIGYKILADLKPIRNLLPGVLYHHERYDGAGYPEGLAGESIPRLARILAVADAYDAMSTARPYRQAMPVSRVEEILSQGAGIQWDRQIIEAFEHCRQKIHAIRQRGVGESLRQALDDALRTGDSSIVGNANVLGSPT